MENKKVGVMIGKFLPFHNGHSYIINKAATFVEKLYVVVDEHPIRDRELMGELRYPNLKTRMQWVTSIFKDVPHIEVVALSEEGIQEYPNGWKEWSEKVKKTIDDNITHIFTSDNEYKDGYAKYFSNWTPVFFDNDRNATDGISSTAIRKDLYKHWTNMPSIVRQFFAKKIFIVGGESTGKTTLVRAMSKIFNTSWSEEVGRSFCDETYGKYFDKNNFVLLNEQDYIDIAKLQYFQNKKAIKTANKFTLIDTDAIYTQNFYEQEFKTKNDEIEKEIVRQKELNDAVYIYLGNKVPFVQDHMRDNKTRKSIKEYYNQYIEFDYEIEESDYTSRFDEVFKIIKKELGYV